MPKGQITIEERKIKIFYNPEMEDLPFPEKQSYKLLVERPENLKDINETEGVKLTGIEDGADVTADNPQGVSWLTDAGAMAYEDLVELAKLGTTIVEGGYLKTILIDASFVQAGILTGILIRTAATGQRVVISGATNTIEFFDSGGVSRGTIYGITQGIGVTGNIYGSSIDITCYKLYLNAASGMGIEPTWTNSIDLGSISKMFKGAYFGSRLKIPVGTNMYD